MGNGEEGIGDQELGFAFGTFEEIFRTDPHECTCHSCSAPLMLDCYGCGQNDWELILFGRHLQMRCRGCGRGLCLNTEATSLQISRYLLSPEIQIEGELLEDQVQQVLAGIKHPEIGLPLVELGMLKDVSVSKNKVALTLATPFGKVSIEDILISIIREAIGRLGAELEINRAVMTQKERNRFLSMSQEWRDKTFSG
ncbi:MAG: iron-sulfur cluster assembly protein [Dehalococcoidia bacterium]